MSSYIEKETPGEFFNHISSTYEINPDKCANKSCTSEIEENIARWKWLTDNWENMTFKERMSLFYPKIHHITFRDIERVNFDDVVNSEIIDTAYKFCRNINSIKYDLDRQGIPTILIEFAPIDIDQIPDNIIQSSVRAWGYAIGFLKRLDVVC